MKEKLQLFLLGFFLVPSFLSTLFFFGCDEDKPSQVSIVYHGVLAIHSNPPGAKIYFLGNDIGKVTPDSINGLETGSYNVKLSKQDYYDTVFNVVVYNNQKTLVDVELKSQEYGSLIIQSTPAGATVFVDNVNKGTTNTTVSNVRVGSRTVRLELEGYRDTTFTVTIVKDHETLKQVTLTTSTIPPTLTKHGPVRIWETTGTGASQPSGLDLSAGVAKSSADPSVDLYFLTNSNFTLHELRRGQSRNTSFFIGASTVLDDSVDSPLALPSWLEAVSDGETNYFFAYDDDSHYSKVKIVDRSPSGEHPSWLRLEWYYNNTVNDNRF